PFTWVPEKVAGLLFRGLSAALFLGGLAVWVRHGLPRPLTPGETGAVFTLAGPLALNSLNNGQTNLPIIGALLFGATPVARGPWRGTYQAIQLGAAAAMLAGVLLAAWRTRDRRFTSALGLHLGCIWMTVLGPATEAHTYAILAPTAAAVAVLAYSDRKERGGW